MKTFEYTVHDQRGIHARIAGYLTHTASAFPCRVVIQTEKKEADAKNMIMLMNLGVKWGQTITIRTDGEQEEEAMAAMKKFCEENL